MSVARLSVMKPAAAVGAALAPAACNAERVRRLQAQARALACEHADMLAALLDEAAIMARDIAQGGDAYPVGAREMAQRLADDLPTRALTLKAVAARSL